MMRHIDLRSMSYDGVNKLTEKEIESGVRNHINWMQNAVYDMVEFDFETENIVVIPLKGIALRTTPTTTLIFSNL
jgi:hypothetical protein